MVEIIKTDLKQMTIRVTVKDRHQLMEELIHRKKVAETQG